MLKGMRHRKLSGVINGIAAVGPGRDQTKIWIYKSRIEILIYEKMFSARADTRNISYTVESVHPAPDATALMAAATDDPSVSAFTHLPPMPADIRDLTTKVTEVPSSDHQRMYSSLPFGKNSSPAAKASGRKMSTDIRIRSGSLIDSHQRSRPNAQNYPAPTRLTK